MWLDESDGMFYGWTTWNETMYSPIYIPTIKWNHKQFKAVLFSNPPILAVLVQFSSSKMTSRVGASFAWDKQARCGTLQSFGVSSLVGTSGLYFFSGKCILDGLWNWVFVEEKTWVEGCVVFLLKVCHHPHGLSICRPQELDTLLAGSPLRNMSGCHHFLNEAKNPDIKVCGDQGLRCVSFRIWGWNNGILVPSLVVFSVSFVEVLLPSGSGGTGVSWSSGEPRIAQCMFFFFSGNTKSFIIGNRMSVRSHKLWRTWSGI